MAAPIYNNIGGVCTAAPGTGAFTPTGAATGCRAWSNVPSGWFGMVRYEDTGNAWGLQYSYWNGTTLSRSSNQDFASSTGSPLSLTAAATAYMVVDAKEVQPHIGGTPWFLAGAIPGQVTLQAVRFPTITLTGTAGSAALAATNSLTEQPRLQLTSATLANNQAGASVTTALAIVNSTAQRGGFEGVFRFGASTLPTGPRLFVGMTATTFVANTAEPSALVANYAVFAKDSTDTNIQLLTNSNAGAGTKIDTGIPLVANGWYESSVWVEPGSTTVWGLLVRLDTGAVWLGSTSTDVPATGALMFPQLLGGLSATTGTAFVMHVGSMAVRSGS